MQKIAIVRWVDATHVEDDIYETKLFKQDLLEFTSVGLVVTEDENKLVLASTIGYDEDGTFYRSSLLLPKKIIVEIIVLPVTTSEDKTVSMGGKE